MAQEPWPGYSGMSAARRKTQLDMKVDEARLRWDLLYAHAVAAAVANYEALERQGAEPTEAEQAANDHVAEIKKYGDWGFDKAGGWGH